MFSKSFSVPRWRYPMIGLASMIRSPSIFRMTRSTPCVDGCCGPKLTSISWTSNIALLPPRFGYQLLQHVFRFRLARHAQREVLRLAFGNRLRVAFAVPPARRAVRLRHRCEQLVLERARLGQIHALVQALVRVVPR